MILGLGSDLTDIRRIKKALERFDRRFMQRCFTKQEQALAESRRAGAPRISAYAKRFAAKEACAKALGTGFAQGVYMKDIGVLNAPSGAPSLTLTGGALRRLKEITPSGYDPVLHLSLSDEPPLGYAQVIIEARPVLRAGDCAEDTIETQR